jgi:hypothetical protein
MNKWFFCLLLAPGLISCKSKKKEEEKSGEFFSVLSLIQSQVKKVDSSAARIRKIEKNGAVADTVVISREEFRRYARDFLMIPDISTPERKKLYEESKGPDKSTNSILYTYTTKDPDQEVRRETVMFEPDSSGIAQLSVIIIDLMNSNGDSTVIKNMVWYVDRSFHVITKTSKDTGPEQVRSVMVKWD